MDAGVTRTKKIRGRRGMSTLYDLVESGHIGLVAAQDGDCFFRNVTMIETNVFIDACKRNNVQVVTPMMIYDFAHPIMGSSHMRMFCEKAQRAADYLQYQMRGKTGRGSSLPQRQQDVDAEGKILPGFMMDGLSQSPNGTLNPN